MMSAFYVLMSGGYAWAFFVGLAFIIAGLVASRDSLMAELSLTFLVIGFCGVGAPFVIGGAEYGLWRGLGFVSLIVAFGLLIATPALNFIDYLSTKINRR